MEPGNVAQRDAPIRPLSVYHEKSGLVCVCVWREHVSGLGPEHRRRKISFVSELGQCVRWSRIGQAKSNAQQLTEREPSVRRSKEISS